MLDTQRTQLFNALVTNKASEIQLFRCRALAALYSFLLEKLIQLQGGHYTMVVKCKEKWAVKICSSCGYARKL